MCACWGYPSKGWQNNDITCNTTNGDLAGKCGVPYTHYPIRGTPLDTEPVITIMNFTDQYICETSIYPAPLGLAWGCSDGRFYSYLTLEYHGRLRCGLGIPSLCPSHMFDFVISP